MLDIVRVKINTEVTNGSETHYVNENQKHFWDYVYVNQPSWDTDGVCILYLTQRHSKNEVSLIIKSKDQGHLSQYLLNKLSPIKYVDGFWIINLFEPKFFVPPDDDYKKLSRFTLNISSTPNNYRHIYEKISKMLPNKNFMISYVAYTFHKFKSDIIVSILCTGSSTLNDIVEKYIKTIEGVTNVEATRITNTKKISAADDWKTISTAIPEDGQVIEEQSNLEEDMMSGC